MFMSHHQTVIKTGVSKLHMFGNDCNKPNAFMKRLREKFQECLPPFSSVNVKIYKSVILPTVLYGCGTWFF
jgi:hypothetical protein